MRHFYLFVCSFFMLITTVASLNYALADGKNPRKSDTTKLVKVFTNKNDKSYLKNGIKIPLPALKAGITIYGSNSTLNRNSLNKFDQDKLLSNVQVFPNPITDQINLRYYVAKNSNVSIKIMDVLGNEVITLFSQRVDPGEQKFTFNLNNKLSSGFYFIRMMVGTEAVMKRISIL
ncbi:MAG: T9SS type A sorting domain-containing protein [Mucilaginibacter sp.]|uniref:T9SS type A sorting domain-containing protein n=1 Tax=Mucilaginibacter sp. TaxID=1882438 RepID=UPI003266581E